MNSGNVYLENRILLLWFAKALKHFMKRMLSFCLIVLDCFCHVMNDHPPLNKYCPRKTGITDNKK